MQLSRCAEGATFETGYCEGRIYKLFGTIDVKIVSIQAAGDISTAVWTLI